MLTSIRGDRFLDILGGRLGSSSSVDVCCYNRSSPHQLLGVLPLTEITTVAVAFRLGSRAWSSDSSCSGQSNHSRGSLESPTPVGKCVLIAFG
jgi:hypothetical protein